MRRLLHRLVHALGANHGTVEVFWEGKRLMVGFRCVTCNALSRVHESPTTAIGARHE